MRVTFDTNVFGPVACPEKYSSLREINIIKQLRELLILGQFEAFISEASLSLDAINHEERVDVFFREWANKYRNIILPNPSPERKEIIACAMALGIKILHVPRVALGSFIDIPSEYWAKDDVFPQSERIQRINSFTRIYAENGLTRLQKFGDELAKKHTLENEFWLDGIVTEYDQLVAGEKKKFVLKVREMVAEWSDLDIIASHYGYGIDYLCTIDCGHNSGANSLFGETSRKNLKCDHGISVISPKQLIALFP